MEYDSKHVQQLIRELSKDPTTRKSLEELRESVRAALLMNAQKLQNEGAV